MEYDRSNSIVDDEVATANLILDTTINPDGNCDAVLGSVDQCVGIIDSVDAQHKYESDLHKKDTAYAEHGLTEAESTLIRLQIMEEKAEGAAAAAARSKSPCLPDLDDVSTLNLNLCGSTDHDDHKEEKVCSFFPNNNNDEVRTSASTNNGTGVSPASVTAVTTNSSVDSPQSALGENQQLSTTNLSSALPQQNLSCAIPARHEAKCIICFGDPGSNKAPGSPRSMISFTNMPCCSSRPSNNNGVESISPPSKAEEVCTACILLLSYPTSDGKKRIGRCPRCRSWVAIETQSNSHQQETTNNGLPGLPVSLTITVLKNNNGKCNACNQEKDVLVENDNDDVCCDACFLGRRRPLLYECEQCHVKQKIPHPMYRYQPSKDSFGTTSWKCQGSCQNFTMWRLVSDQITLIPAGDTPAGWNDNYLEIARGKVLEARRSITDANNNDDENNNDASFCTIQ